MLVAVGRGRKNPITELRGLGSGALLVGVGKLSI